MAVYRDLPALDIIEPHQQVHQRGLARAGGPYNGHLLPMLYLHSEVPNQRRFWIVAEIHIFKIHIALYFLRQVPLDGLLLRGVLHLIHPSGGGADALDRPQHLGDLLQRRGKLPGVQQHRYHGTHTQGSLYC